MKGKSFGNFHNQIENELCSHMRNRQPSQETLPVSFNTKKIFSIFIGDQKCNFFSRI